MKYVSESLAGRIGLLSLLPFQLAEIPKNLQNESVFRGGYPELVNRGYRFSDAWYASYLDTYLTRDVRALRDIGNIREFQRLITLLAGNTSQILNMTEYATQLGVTVKTIQEWISVLEASLYRFFLPPFYKNYGKRITKRPKLYFYDTGLVSYLTGIQSKSLIERGPMTGAIFENYVISEILKKEKHSGQDSQLFYIRTSSHQEVDLLIDRKQSKELIEIKHSDTFHSKMLKGIETFIDTNDSGYLLYNGKTLPKRNAVTVMNIKDYLSYNLNSR